MSAWVHVTISDLTPEQLKPVADLVKVLHDAPTDYGLLEVPEVEPSYAPRLVLFLNVPAEDVVEAAAQARAAITAARDAVHTALVIGPNGWDPLNTVRTITDEQISFDPGFERLGTVFVRKRHGVVGRVASELEVPARVIQGAIWNIWRGTSSRVIIPKPNEAPSAGSAPEPGDG